MKARQGRLSSARDSPAKPNPAASMSPRLRDSAPLEPPGPQEALPARPRSVFQLGLVARPAVLKASLTAFERSLKPAQRSPEGSSPSTARSGG
jgi:hypothetical protein